MSQGARNNERQLQELEMSISHDDVGRLTSMLHSFDPRASDAEGMTPLMYAAQFGSLNCLKLLLPLSDGNAVDRYGMNAMTWAVANGRLEACKALLPYSDLEARDKAGWTASMMASDTTTFLLLLEHCEPKTRTGHATEALHLAASDGRIEMVETLLPLADIHSQDSKGNTARDYAVGEGHDEVINLIDAYLAEQEREALQAAVPVSPIPKRTAAGCGSSARL